MGHHSSSKSTTTTDTSSMLWKLPGYKDMVSQAVANAGEMPAYQYVGLNEAQQNSINGMIGNNPVTNAADYYQQTGQQLTGQGQSLYGSGSSTASQALSRLNQIQGMSASDYNSLISQYTNSDLIKQQTARAQEASANQFAGALQQINRGAAMSGTMGSSRAGVASGVAAGEANQNLLDVTTRINENAYQNAMQLANAQISRSSALNQGLLSSGLQSMQLGANVQGQGLSAYGQGVNAWQRAMSNQYQAGSLLQQNAQNQMSVDRMNQMLKDNPALFRVALLNSQLPQLAAPYTSSSSTSKTSGGGGLGGVLGAVGMAAGIGLAPFTGGASLGLSTAEMGMFGGAIGSGLGSAF